jgi:hypothetical protein
MAPHVVCGGMHIPKPLAFHGGGQQAVTVVPVTTSLAKVRLVDGYGLPFEFRFHGVDCCVNDLKVWVKFLALVQPEALVFALDHSNHPCGQSPLIELAGDFLASGVLAIGHADVHSFYAPGLGFWFLFHQSLYFLHKNYTNSVRHVNRES